MSKPARIPVGIPALRLIPSSLLVLVLGACATGNREGPPAPVVSVTPRQPATEPAAEAKPKAPKPAAPAKPETRTYAYREPGTEPDPEPVPVPVPEAVQAVQDPGSSVPAAPAAQEPPLAGAPAPPVAQSKAPPPRAAAPTTAAAPKDAPPARAPAPEPETQVASAPAPASPAAPSAAPPATPAPADKPLAPGLPPAADGLARQAEQQRQQGDYAGAAATLERSLRIAPREAYLWNRLARVRMEQGLSAQAGQLAARSNDLAGSAGNIKQDNWRIIAESRRRSGDMAGASEAEQRAGGG